MKTAHINPVRWVQLFVFLLLVGSVAYAAWWVQGKHRYMQEALADINSKHARLQGILDSGEKIIQARDGLTAQIAATVYPAGMDATKAGNDAQQRISAVLSAAQLTVMGIQVLPPDGDAAAFEQIPISVQAEGSPSAVGDALQVLATVQADKPVVLTRSLQVQAVGAVRPNEPVKLSVRVQFVVLRAKS